MEVSGKVIKSLLFSLYVKPSAYYVVLYIYIEHNKDTYEKEILMIVWKCTEIFDPHEDPVPLGCDILSLCQEIPTMESNNFSLKVGM
jgi:hypothetical protein